MFVSLVVAVSTVTQRSHCSSGVGEYDRSSCIVFDPRKLLLGGEHARPRRSCHLETLGISRSNAPGSIERPKLRVAATSPLRGHAFPNGPCSLPAHIGPRAAGMKNVASWSTLTGTGVASALKLLFFLLGVWRLELDVRNSKVSRGLVRIGSDAHTADEKLLVIVFVS